MQIGITISNQNYIKAFKLREERKLSGMINTFLTNYFNNQEENADIINQEIQLEKEIKEMQKKIAKKSMKLVLVQYKLKELEKEKKDEHQQQLEEIRTKSRMIKNSGIFDDIGV